MGDTGSTIFGDFGAGWAQRSAGAAARQAVLGLDRRLRKSERITEFTDDPKCVLRVSPGAVPRDIVLSDGPVPVGARLLDLHLWNEHMPPMPASGPSMAWSARALRRVVHSFGLLAEALTGDGAFADVRVVRARLAWARLGRSAVYERLGERLGLEEAGDERAEVGRQVHDALENLWLAALDWTFNPAVQPRLRLMRAREELWISRRKLIARFADTRFTRPLQG